MNRDNKLMYEAFNTAQYDKLARVTSNLHLAHDALKACYKHFTSEPNDPGHPMLIKLVGQALEEIKHSQSESV